jgi:hypothetical protein
MGVKLLDLDTDDKVASATVIPPEDPKPPTKAGHCSNSHNVFMGARTGTPRLQPWVSYHDQ